MLFSGRLIFKSMTIVDVRMNTQDNTFSFNTRYACMSTNNKVESKIKHSKGTSLYLCRQLQNKTPEIE